MITHGTSASPKSTTSNNPSSTAPTFFRAALKYPLRITRSNPIVRTKKSTDRPTCLTLKFATASAIPDGISTEVKYAINRSLEAP